MWVWEYVHTSTGIFGGNREHTQHPEAGVTSSWKSLTLSVGNKAGVLCKTCQCSYLLNPFLQPLKSRTFQNAVLLFMRKREIPHQQNPCSTDMAVLNQEKVKPQAAGHEGANIFTFLLPRGPRFFCTRLSLTGKKKARVTSFSQCDLKKLGGDIGTRVRPYHITSDRRVTIAELAEGKGQPL